MTSEIVKVTKGELVSANDYSKRLQEQNCKLVALRKKHIYTLLKDATEKRLETSKNISSWIKMLADKIFNPSNIEEMDLNKAIALFKYINNINLKVLAESNRLEEVLGKYIESGVMEVDVSGGAGNERDKIKHELLQKLNKMFKESSEEVEIKSSESEETTLSEEEVNELKEAERKLEENFIGDEEEIEHELQPENVEDLD